MSLAHDKAPVGSKKLIVNPVKRQRHMAASVDVCEKPACMIDYKAFFIKAAKRHDEFQGLAGGNLDYAANDVARVVSAAFLFHDFTKSGPLLVTVCTESC
jgi:hypothetical protein